MLLIVKKNLLSIAILALLIVNVVLTSVMLFSVNGTMKKSAALIDSISVALKLEMNEGISQAEAQSIPMEDILKEVNELKASGVKEVTLLSQNVNADGKDLKDGSSFAELLRPTALTGIERIRFMTSHPWDFTDEMIDAAISEFNNKDVLIEGYAVGDSIAITFVPIKELSYGKNSCRIDIYASNYK